jgi:predicted MPP superfamily phosphohydrolase
LSAGIYGFFVEPHKFEVNHLWIKGSGLYASLQGKTLLHISDLHISVVGKREQEVLEKVNEVKADLVFLTGDYVKWREGHDAALELLSQLRAKVGVFAVMGDYDYSVSRKSCLFCHEKASGEPTKRHSVQFLRNSVEALELAGGRAWIAGVDGQNGEPEEIRKRVREWKGKGPMILLSHNPLNFDLVDEDQELLMLSGDTHGGQIPLPSWLWRILGYEKNSKYNEGLFEKGKKKLFVNRGIGTSHIPFRLFKRPEVVVLHFQ